MMWWMVKSGWAQHVVSRARVRAAGKIRRSTMEVASNDVAMSKKEEESVGNNSMNTEDPNHMSPSQTNIRRLETSSIHRLVAGQAICSLPTAVKELMDNALDARARHINGAYICECVSNACGEGCRWCGCAFGTSAE